MEIKSIEDVLSLLEDIKLFLAKSSGSVVKTLSNTNDEFVELAALLGSDDWPAAVDEDLICKTTEDKLGRGEVILDVFLESDFPNGSKFLDFGCGEGYMAKAAADRGFIATGYDPVVSGDLEWEAENGGCLLTSDLEKVKAKGPFDCVLIYDVLDHVKNPAELLSQVASLCTPATKINVRCHPWCSRHGSHLYLQKNKAFIHLIFSEDELEKLSIKTEFIKKTIHPLMTYRNWMREFKIIKEEVRNVPVEPFFKNKPLVAKRIVANWRDSPNKDSKAWPGFQLTQTFCDFWIKLK